MIYAYRRPSHFLWIVTVVLWEGIGSWAWELKRFQFNLPKNNYPSSPKSSIPITYYHYGAPSSSISKPSLPFLPKLSLFDQANQKKEQKLPPLFCIHPVGVGLASWYWKRLAQEAANQGNSSRDVYAINLPGCGSVDLARICDENEAKKYWESFASIPLADIPQEWVDVCQAMLEDVILKSSTSCQLVVQGGLAPIGVALAAQNPDRVSSLVLTSPPTFRDMTTAVPMKDVMFNYNFLKSPIFGKLAFGVLESRWAIEVFSNAFLFQQPCDDEWLDLTLQEACPETRPPIQAFNAGVCVLKSMEEELQMLQQPTLILQGDSDTSQRREGRLHYVSGMTTSRVALETLSGKSLLPWENPQDTWNVIQQFTMNNSQQR
jgi:pimeloyl-ACP methyl ester carboxylesterase